MSGHEPTLKNKVSPHIQTQLPEFVQSDHPLFGLFLKYYYEFLEAGELVVTGSNDYVIEETISKNYILDETGENIVLEESVGKFTVGETITGSTSGATAKILVDDFDDNKRLFITSQQRFETGETVTGNTSGAITTVSSYRANPVQNIQQLLAYADVDNTVYEFLDKFRDSFMESLPNTLADGIAKRKLIKNIKDMYAAKGTRDGHKLFFRILFNEEATLIYPRDNMLRVSDGQWSTDRVIRIIEAGTSDFTKAIGQTVTGSTSGATALIATVIKFREGADLIAEINLDTNSVSGTFAAGEVVTTTDVSLDLEISGTVKGIVTGGNVTVGGAYYSTGDPVSITGGGGNNAASARVESAGAGSIDEIVIESGGSGYTAGEELRFDLTNTEGADVRARIAVVGGAFVLEQSTSPDNIITEDGDLIVTDDDIQYISKEQTVGELDHLVLEDGDQIVLEEATFTDLGVASEIGEITKVHIINRGNGFIKLPLVSDSLTTTGTGASLFAASTVSPMVGHVEGISITNFGLDYASNPVITLNRNILVQNVTGSFAAGDTLTSHNATVVDFDSARNILELSTSVDFNEDDTITSVTGATATIYQSTPSEATSTIGTVGTTVGNFVGDRGKVSVDTMRIQDSFYYQDYSYVVRIGESINLWRESVRRSVHPAGWNVFGEVSFASQVAARIQNPAAGSVTDSGSPDTFTPELASTFTNLFTTIFGRRLGTTTDGTSLRNNPSDGSSEPLSTGVREVTLTSAVTVSMGLTTQTENVLGPTLDLLPKYAFAVPPINTVAEPPHYPGITRSTRSNDNNGAYFTIDQFGQYRINEVSARIESDVDYDFDGSNTSFDDTTSVDFSSSGRIGIPAQAFITRINVPPPGEIIVSSNTTSAFDQTFLTFDDTRNLFDEEGAPRATSGLYYTSYDENGISFDDATESFDEGAPTKQMDALNISFDENVHTFDETL